MIIWKKNNENLHTTRKVSFRKMLTFENAFEQPETSVFIGTESYKENNLNNENDLDKSLFS